MRKRRGVRAWVGGCEVDGCLSLRVCGCGVCAEHLAGGVLLAAVRTLPGGRAQGGGGGTEARGYRQGERATDTNRPIYTDRPGTAILLSNHHGPALSQLRRVERLTGSFVLSNLLSDTQVGGVNCAAHGSLCEQHGIRMYPTVKLFVNGEATPYEGAVEPALLQTFVQQNIPADIANVRRVQTATEMLAAGKRHKKPCALLFTAKYDTSALYKSMAHSFKDVMKFGEVRATNLVVSDKYAVGKYPTLLVFCNGDESQVVEYHGEFKAKEIRDFLSSVKDNKACLAAAKVSKRSPPRQKPKIDLTMDFQSMRVAQLKRMLDEQAEECVGCVEKADYIRKLKAVAETQ